MALVSPGVEVTIDNQSQYAPAASGSVPLIFITTASEKSQPNGDPALGTYEHNEVRLVTSINRSVELYGTPMFYEDADGNQLHGDARNEYGLFALNQFLSVGNRAYVVRVNVNTNDDPDAIADLWERKTIQNTLPYGAAFLFEVMINDFLEQYNSINGLVPTNPGYKTTIDENEFMDLIDQATTSVFGKSVQGVNVYFEDGTFYKTRPDLFTDVSSTPWNIYGNGFDQAPTGTYLGIAGTVSAIVNQSSPSFNGFTAFEARNLMVDIFTDYSFTTQFVAATSIGYTNSSRRAAIVQALKSSIVSNQNIRSEAIEYSLVCAPGFYEVASDLVGLAQDLDDEVFVISDTPFDLSPEDTVGWASTPDRARAFNISYNYPHGIGTNLDGKEVFVSSSGSVLRTYVRSDNLFDIWFAPAGQRRGLMAGISRVGYITNIGSAAPKFEEVSLNKGQQAALYDFMTNINPIITRPNMGVMLYGQKTSDTIASALDRVNVARLVVFLKRQLRKDSEAFVFELNDQLTRDNWKAVIDGRLNGIMIRRGLYDYATTSDETVNTPDVIDRNEAILLVAIKPTKVAEFLYIPLQVLSTGQQI